MLEIMAVVTILLLLTAVIMLALLLRRAGEPAAIPEELLRRLDFLEQSQDRLERAVHDDFVVARKETGDQAGALRVEVQNSLKNVSDSILKGVGAQATSQKNQLDTFSQQLLAMTKMNEQKLEQLRLAVEERLRALQDDNSKKLELMRQTVDEKLKNTLEQRLGESFKLVSDRLELVHRGLGEMTTLAGSVGDLKRVLNNVKTRGIWGEIQLATLLEQILTPEQYGVNVATKPESRDRVEFAIKLPGRDELEGQVVWLPVDAKFPKEDYERLLEAQDKADTVRAEECAKALEAQLKQSARDISEKYLSPPATTDFGIMFLPVEGLFAEAIRRPGLLDFLQREYRVVVAGPTTLAALLNSLQMGFRTLAIQKRSSEVWKILGAVKTEFGKFAEILDKVQDKLRQASNTIDDAARKSRTIERRLKDVTGLPAADTQELLGGSDDLGAPVSSPAADQADAA